MKAILNNPAKRGVAMDSGRLTVSKSSSFVICWNRSLEVMDIADTMSTRDFFRSRLDATIDLHPLPLLVTRIPWAQIEATLALIFARQAREERAAVAWICSARPWR